MDDWQKQNTSLSNYLTTASTLLRRSGYFIPISSGSVNLFLVDNLIDS
jgi:hypothetical protein